ncbi:hypothetical protein JZM24_16210 [Candidatus Sodalis endolongispinus]|uniref:Uncharacterized protein n=1 Tax=Candidatus Sodalis endolongispinus TaxID=2812662 RepID=A0ABS5YE81_9GAMM|nr:hypothetical protein [Candidatus Sodalis endolongispinus]MBT9433272.1 hypothetical protein [Candidatus Sodalis endolongispinus]
MNLVTIFCIDDRGKWKFLSLTEFLPVQKGVSGGLGSRRISSLMTVYKYDSGIILRPVVLIFLLVALLYWLGKLPGTLSPAEKKGAASCDMTEAVPLSARRTLDQEGPGMLAFMSGADPSYSQIPNYSPGNAQLTQWRRAKITPVSVCCQKLYCRIKLRKIIFFNHMKKILKREIRHFLKFTRPDKKN